MKLVGDWIERDAGDLVQHDRDCFGRCTGEDRGACNERTAVTSEREAGARAVFMAEPTAGLLSPRGLAGIGERGSSWRIMAGRS